MNKDINDYLRYVYFSGKNLNKIYSILASLNKTEKGYEWLNTSLINEQLAIKDKYIPNNNAEMFSYKSWLALNIKKGKRDNEFFNDVANKSTKIYVSFDTSRDKEKNTSKIVSITGEIFKFLSDNNIECQTKIGSNLRTDVLTIRVCNKEDVSKVVDFINGMDYTPNLFPNPFLLKCGKVSIARDGGRVSYNEILAEYINKYFYYNESYNENHNDFKDISSTGFAKFLAKELSVMDKNRNHDLYMVTDLIYRNTMGTLTLDDIINYGETKEKNTSYAYNKNNEESTKDVDKSTEYILLIEKLKNYYENNREYMINERKEEFDSGIDYAHAVVEAYMKTGSTGYFTRNAGNIRDFVQKNFDVSSMRETINNLGWVSIIDASRETIEKYGSAVNITGTEEDKGIVEKLLSGEEKLENGKSVFSLFTNTNNVRSRLGYLISPKMARDILINKLNIDPHQYNPIPDELKNDISEISSIILEEA